MVELSKQELFLYQNTCLPQELMKATATTPHNEVFHQGFFFSKCEQILKKPWICSHLLKKNPKRKTLFFEQSQSRTYNSEMNYQSV